MYNGDGIKVAVNKDTISKVYTLETRALEGLRQRAHSSRGGLG